MHVQYGFGPGDPNVTVAPIGVEQAFDGKATVAQTINDGGTPLIHRAIE